MTLALAAAVRSAGCALQRVTAGACALWLSAQAVHAQPAAADRAPQPAGRAASLLALTASEVFLKSETVEFAFVPEQRAWRVSAHYDFVNPAERALSVQLVLPEGHCDDESEFDDACDPSRAPFSVLEAKVRDRTQRLRKARIPGQPGATAAAPEWGWFLPLQLAAAEAQAVDMQYLVPAGESGEGGWSASYLVRGSAHWSKPVGHAIFKFSFTARSCLIVEPEQLTRRSRRVVLHDDEPWLEVAYEAYVWVPPNEVSLYFEPCVAPRDTEIAGCSAASDLARFFYPADSAEEVEAIDETGLRKVLDKLGDEELKRCRDGVFNTYASYFQEPELKRLPSHAEQGRSYTAPLLTAADWNWVHFLDQRVAERDAARKQKQAAERAARAREAQRGCGCSLLGACTSRPGLGALWWFGLVGLALRLPPRAFTR